jgi:hypothetical protein
MNVERWHKSIPEGMFLAEESSGDYPTFPHLRAERRHNNWTSLAEHVTEP